MSKAVASAKELRRLLQQGWELHYIAQKAHKLPGNWEMRYRREVIPVAWECIESARRGLKWWRDNTEEIQCGRNWVYRMKQASLSLPVASKGGQP